MGRRCALDGSGTLRRSSTYCFHAHVTFRFFESDRSRPTRRVPVPRNTHSGIRVISPAGTKQPTPDFLTRPDEAIGGQLQDSDHLAEGVAHFRALPALFVGFRMLGLDTPVMRAVESESNCPPRAPRQLQSVPAWREAND